MMKRNLSITIFAVLSLIVAMAFSSCGEKNTNDKSDKDSTTTVRYVTSGDEIPMREVTITKDGFPVTYNVADVDDRAAEYSANVKPENCFIVISKKEFRLYVYEKVNTDTMLVAHFPICYAKYKGPKQVEGDMKTPETTSGIPFIIAQIRDYSARSHDFGDGRGSILSYGHWFMALQLNGYKGTGSGIGIHGSTNNAESVPGCGSEGCIRLRDADINTLHDKYAMEAMDVYIKGCDENKLPYELNAEKALGKKYKAQKYGNPVLAKSKAIVEDNAGSGEDVIEGEK